MDVEDFRKLEHSYSSLKIKKIDPELSEWFLELKTNLNEILSAAKKLRSEEEL